MSIVASGALEGPKRPLRWKAGLGYTDDGHGGAMTAKAILRQTMSEKQYKKLPARVRHIIKIIDALPPTPKPVTVKQFAELFR